MLIPGQWYPSLKKDWNMEKSLLDHALAYQELGWSVIPIPPKTKQPNLSWKKYQKKAASQSQIKKWWTEKPDYNIGIITGAISEVIVVDIDSFEGQEVYRNTIGAIPNTIRQTTGKPGALHALFKHNGTNIPNAVGLLDGVDIRADGGLIIAAPSIHPNGSQYKWLIDPTEMGLDDLMDIPEELLKILVSDNGDNKKSKNPDGWVSEALMGVDKGCRDATAVKLAGYFLRTVGADINLITANLTNWNLRNTPPLGLKIIEKCIASVIKMEGERELSNTIGETVTFMEIYKYPDGDKRYKVYLTGHDNPVSLDKTDDIMAQRKFRIAVCKAIDRIMPKMNLDKWEAMMNKVLANAKKIIVPEEETALGTIRHFINKEANSKSVTDDPKYIENRVILVDGMIYLKNDVVLRSVYDLGTKIGSKTCGDILRKNMGFEYKKYQVGGVRFRGYRIDKKQWDSQFYDAF
jgi:hypothetical protein